MTDEISILDGLFSLDPIAIDSRAYVTIVTHMPRRPTPRSEDPKVAALRAAGTLHPHPESIHDAAFSSEEFFDRRDRLQVRYEMLRRHRVEQRPVTEVAVAFGASRQAFYTAARAFEVHGIAGLLPQPRGPKRAHKCSDEILDFVERWRGKQADPREPQPRSSSDASVSPSIHARSTGRSPDGKKTARPGECAVMKVAVGDPHYPIAEYEVLRREATASGRGIGRRGHGLALLLARGMRAWFDALTAWAPRPPFGERPLEAARRDRVALEPTLRADLTTMLAAMVLACTARC